MVKNRQPKAEKFIEDSPEETQANLNSRNGLYERLEVQQSRVICGPDVNYHTSSTIAANQYQLPGTGSGFKLSKFRSGLNIKILRYEAGTMEFEIKGISCAIANTLRRIMIAEIPTMAIEHVYIVNNTSIIQDEVLAHRLGLIPLAVDPRLFKFRAEDEIATPHNTIILKMKVECRRLADGTIENANVYSRDLQWLPDGSELPEETGASPFGNDQKVFLDEVRPVHEDILVAKLRPGQAIELECHCIKGVGEEHAKWSPVATTWYRLYPEVVILREPPIEIASKLASELPGLLYLENNGLTVADNLMQHEKLLEKVRQLSGMEEYMPYIQLRKKKNHFIFTIESTGAWKPHELFHEAVDRIVAKCDKVLEGLSQYETASFDYK